MKRKKEQEPILKAIRCHRVLPDGSFVKLNNVYSLSGYKNIKDIAWQLWAKKRYKVQDIVKACNISLGLALKWETQFIEKMKKIVAKNTRR